MKRLLIMLALLTLAPLSGVHAGSFWNVNRYGNDLQCNGALDADANAPTTVLPNCGFLTLQRAVDAAACGDVVIVNAGTHVTSGFTAVESGLTVNGLARITSKACTKAKPLFITGVRNAAGDNLSIFDGQDTLQATLRITNSSWIIVQYLTTLNFIGSRENYGASISVLSITGSENMLLRGLVIIHPKSDATADGGGEIAFNTSSNVTLQSIDLRSGYPQLIVTRGAKSGNGGVNVSNNRILNVALGRSRLAQEVGGGNPGQVYDINLKQQRGVSVLSSYFYDTTAYAIPSGAARYGIQYREAQDITISGNVFHDLRSHWQGGNGAYVRGQESSSALRCCGSNLGSADNVCSGGAQPGQCCHCAVGPAGCTGGDGTPDECNERLVLTNNVFFKATNTGVQTRMMNLTAANGAIIQNNIYAVAAGQQNQEQNDIGTGTDLVTGVKGVYDYNFYFNHPCPLAGANTSYTCDADTPSGTCANACGAAATTLGVHSRWSATANPFVLSGSAPSPYFNLACSAGTDCPFNGGNNATCHAAPADGSCDMGAFEMGGVGGFQGAGPPPGGTPKREDVPLPDPE